jgi:hypothetical protein
MRLGDFFRRRRIGPLSVSPFGMVVSLVVLATIWKIAADVFRDMAARDSLYAGLNYARPIVAQAQLVYQQTGQWPVSLAALGVKDAAKPRDVAAVELLGPKGVRITFSGPDVIANKALVLHVISRDGKATVACIPGDMPLSPLPAICKDGY